MPQGKHVEIRGYQNNPLPLSLWEQTEPSESLALVFPGLGYHADLPVLYYPALQMHASGADVLRLEFRYNDQPGFMRQPGETLNRWIGDDAAAVLEFALKRHAYAHITLVGKSLGTVALAELLRRSDQLAAATCLWLTPVFTNPVVNDRIRQASNPGLLAVGTADPYYDAALIRSLEQKPNLRCLVFQGADHSLETPGSALAAVRAMEKILDAAVDLARS